MSVWIYIAAALLMLAFSALFSGAETGFYRVSRLRLRLSTPQPTVGQRLMLALAQQGRPVMMALLVGNNLVNNVLTSIVTLLFFARTERSFQAEFLAVLVVSPALFVFGEMAPKILFCSYANAWMPKISGLIWLTHTALSHLGIIRFLQMLSDKLARLARFRTDSAAAVEITQQRQMRQILHETSEEGLLTPVQKEMMDRLLGIADLTVEQLMIPAGAVCVISETAARDQLERCLADAPYSRRPVVDKNNNWIGYVDLFQILAEPSYPDSIKPFIKPLLWVSPHQSALNALTELCQKNKKIAGVQDPNTKKPMGIITLTDLIEALTGLISH